LQQSTHNILFTRLAGITRQIRDALAANNTEAMASLNREHKEIMDEIRAADLSRDPQLLEIAQQANSEVKELLRDLKEMRDELKNKLTGHDNKKKLAATYGKFAGSRSVR